MTPQSGIQTMQQPALCDYCGVPLSAVDPVAPAQSQKVGARYCCYGCRVLGESHVGAANKFRNSATTGHGSEMASWVKVGVGAMLAGQAMIFGLAVNISPPEAEAYWVLHGGLFLSACLVLVLLGWPMVRSAWDCACRRQWSVEWLFLSGLLGALGASTWSSWTREGAVYYEVVAVLLTVYTAGKTLTAKAKERAFAETQRLRSVFATARRISREGLTPTLPSQTEEVPVEAVEVGDVLLIYPGEAIPVDGRIVRGKAFVRETPLTGEPHPVVRRERDVVWAGSFSEDGELQVRAEVPGRARRLDTLLQSVDQARATLAGTRAQSQADALTSYFLPVVWVVSIGTLVFWSSRGEWVAGLFYAMAVLLVACPCALGLATPLALWNAIGVLAARGLVVRRAESIEKLADVTDVFFDKTGTLSEGRPVMIDFVVDETRIDRTALKRWLKAIQSRSSHPMAKAMADALAPGTGPERISRAQTSESPSLFAGEEEGWQGENVGLGLGREEILQFKTIPACGVEAWVRGSDGTETHLRVGRREWLLDENPEPDWAKDLRSDLTDSRVYVACDAYVVGVAAIREQLRASSWEAIQSTRRLNCGVTILTGDRPERARALLLGTADELASVEVKGNLTPLEKAEYVQLCQSNGGRVLFVGDGINDAPALQAAEVGVAVAGGAALAEATADTVLTGTDLREIPFAIEMGRRIRRSIRSNLWFALFYNGIGMTLAATGNLHPVVAAFLMLGSSAVVSWRALRGAEHVGCEMPSGMSEETAAGTAATLNPGDPLGWRLGGVLVVLTMSLWIQLTGLPMLGQLTSGTTRWVIGVGGFLTILGFVAGWTMWQRLFRDEIRLHRVDPRRQLSGWGWWGMTLAMLGPGNVGMLLGWWMDAGFGPVMKEGVCLCCSARHYFGSSGGIPWMYVGMLVFGVPTMWPFLGGLTGRLGRNARAGLAALGMVFGMGWGAEAVLGWAGPGHPQQFLLAFFGMSAGMILGMFLGCALGEAIAALFPGQRKITGKNGPE